MCSETTITISREQNLVILATCTGMYIKGERFWCTMGGRKLTRFFYFYFYFSFGDCMHIQVKMAEETVKRFTGLNTMFHALPDISTMSMSSFDGSSSDTAADAAVPVKDDPKHHFYKAPNNPITTHDSRPRGNNVLADISSVENVQPNPVPAAGVSGNKMGRTPSLQRVASLERLQKRIRGGASPCGPQSNGEQAK